MMRVDLYETSARSSDMPQILSYCFGAGHVASTQTPGVFEISFNGHSVVAQCLDDRFFCLAAELPDPRCWRDGTFGRDIEQYLRASEDGVSPQMYAYEHTVLPQMHAMLPISLFDRVWLPSEHLLEWKFAGMGRTSIEKMDFFTVDQRFGDIFPRLPTGCHTRSSFEHLMDAMELLPACRSSLCPEWTHLVIHPLGRSLDVDIAVRRNGSICFSGRSLSRIAQPRHRSLQTSSRDAGSLGNADGIWADVQLADSAS